MKKLPFPIIVSVSILLALFVRLFLIPNPGFEADVAFWKSWGLAVLDFGIVKGLPLTNFNYPTPFGYFLGLMAGAYRLFADPHNFQQYWQNTNLLFLIVSKLPAIIADFGIAGIFFWIGRHAKKIGFPDVPFAFYALLGIVYLLNPVSWMDSAWWGQVDSIGVIVFLGAVLLVLKKQPFLAGIVYMVAMMTKLQNMIYGPLFFLFVWEYLGSRGLVVSLIGSMFTFVGLNIEFILSHNMARVLESLTGNYDYFPWLSLNAFNPWWIVSGGHGMQFSDKLLSIGLLNAKTVGLILFSACYLFAVLFMHPFSFLGAQKKANISPIYRFLTAFIIVNAAFFLFQTASHDRYAFPLVVFLLLWAPFFLQKNSYKSLQVFTKLSTSTSYFFIFFSYVIFSVLYFYNLHTALVINYPHNGLPILSSFIQPSLTMGVSFMFTGAFLWFLFSLRRDTSASTYLFPIGCVLIILIAKNFPLFTKQPVYITALTPLAYGQDYGQWKTNMPVDASFGFNKWGFLSVQYAFYRHGIGTHAKGSQTYHIGSLFRKFSFDYGIDTEAGSKGTVTFEVYGDDKLVFASQPIGRYDLPRHADVDITGVKFLKLVVTDAGDGITDDHADWLNPQLWPK